MKTTDGIRLGEHQSTCLRKELPDKIDLDRLEKCTDRNLVKRAVVRKQVAHEPFSTEGQKSPGLNYQEEYSLSGVLTLASKCLSM